MGHGNQSSAVNGNHLSVTVMVSICDVTSFIPFYTIYHLCSRFCCLFPDNSSRYHLIREHKNWHESLSYCRKNFIDLVSIRNEEQNSKVLEVKSRHENNTWIGLRSDSWEWSDNGQRIPDNGLIFHSAYIATTQNGMPAICYKGIELY